MIVATALLALGSSMVLADPPIPNWGGNETTKFWSGIIHMSDPADAPSFPSWMFDYNYDSSGSIAVDRYDHHAGGSDELCVYCATEYKPGAACSVINAADGVYIQYDNASAPRSSPSTSVRTLAPESVGCCDCSAKVKAAFGTTNLAIRSDFLRANNPTYLGQGSISGQTVDGWLVYGNDANHYWVTANGAQAMVRYNETKHGQLKQWDVESISFEEPQSSLFQRPQGCTVKC